MHTNPTPKPWMVSRSCSAVRRMLLPGSALFPGWALCLLIGLLAGADMQAHGQAAESSSPQWIWAAEQDAGRQVGTVYFRRTFNLRGGQGATLQIACDDSYELYVNGVRVGSGRDWKRPQEYNISSYLVEGRNAVAIAGVKRAQAPAGMVARLTITTADGNNYDLSTGGQWRAGTREYPGWQQAGFNDQRWPAARVLGPIDATEPWIVSDEETAAGETIAEGSPRFRVTREFRIDWLVKGEDSGSLLAMTFNEFGHLLVSRENGGLLLIRDSDGDGRFDRVSTYCDLVKNCQGILALNGEVYVTGDGPEGIALYRLTDENRDGKADRARALVKFDTQVGEHGPHAVKLGPDGLLYVLVGNMARAEAEIADSSPYRNYYEGDLLQPRYEDPTGHAAGVKAPGGHVLRTDIEGSRVELVAGGLRNPYDMAFNTFGELYTSDADMERDHGLPWYRPTRVLHLQPGGEFGWRSGWAKWPAYFIDSLPETLDTGPGSPTGMVFYDHFAFPVRHQKSLFIGDWARGQIIEVALQPDGAGYKATRRVFVEGSPLSVTGLAVGPDGALYFCTGGRGTEGGVYRVQWTGKVPPEVSDPGSGLEAALRQPQIDAAWARQRVAKLKHELGAEWERQLVEIVQDTKVSPQQRMRALDLMQLFGPFPGQELLVEISQDRDGMLRAKAAWMMGLHPGEQTAARLPELLADSSPLVRRIACEALVRSGRAAPAEALLPLLEGRDRSLTTAARRALEIVPRDRWQHKVLTGDELRVFLHGSVALVALSADKDTCLAILARSSRWMEQFIADEDFIDLLRVQQLALRQGGISAEEVPELARRLALEFPAGNAEMNRELVRLIAHLDAPDVADRYLDQLQSEIPMVDKMHLATHAGRFRAAWNTEQKFTLMEFIRQARQQPGGSGFAGYLENSMRDLVAGMNEEERARVLAEADRWPEAGLWAIAKLPQQPDAELRERLRDLHRTLRDRGDEEAVRRLRIGIVAVLARSGDDLSMQYLREVFEEEPQNRGVVAMGLAQQPSGENWPLLIRALPVVEGSAAIEVLNKLATAEEGPERPDQVRQVILLALALEPRSRGAAIRLLEHWSGEQLGGPEDDPDRMVALWQDWFRETFPDELDPVLPQPSETDNYTFAELLEFLDSDRAEIEQADAARGKLVFAKAQCAACHRHGDYGDGIGPDLTTVSRRFHRKEILEAIVYPSHVISDQYAGHTVITDAGLSYHGLVIPSDRGEVTVLQSDGTRVTLEDSQIEEIVPSRRSVMPDGLLNDLSWQEIADLFAYMENRPPTEIAGRGDEEPPR